MSAYARVQISRLERAVARAAGDVRAGQERNAALKARLAVLAVMMRVLDEVVRHKQAVGDDASVEALQLDVMQAAWQPEMAVVAETCLAGVVHMCSDRGLLALERYTNSDVATARGMPFSAIAASLEALVLQGNQHASALASADASSPAAASATEALARCGADILKMHNLLVLYSSDGYMESCCRRYDDGAMCNSAVPPSHWLHVARSTNMCMEQALMFLANCELRRARLAALMGERAALTGLLAEWPASSSSSSSGDRGGDASTSTPAPVPAPGPGPGGAAGCAASWDIAELVSALAANTHSERAVLLLHALVDQAMLSDMQRPLLMGATFPVPLDSDCVEAAVEELRASEGEAAFPWAGRPWN